jgi:PIN like domain
VRSRRSSGRQRGGNEPPEFLIDRSLGRLARPAALREVGLVVRTLAEVYGEQASQDVEDHQWIALAAENDWAVFCKDDRIRRRPAEREALSEGNVRAFCLTQANLTFTEQAEYFVYNRFRILQASCKLGPYLYGVYKDHLKRLWPK